MQSLNLCGYTLYITVYIDCVTFCASQFCHRLASCSASVDLPEVFVGGLSPGGGGGLPEQRKSSAVVGAEGRTTCGHVWTEGNRAPTYTWSSAHSHIHGKHYVLHMTLIIVLLFWKSHILFVHTDSKYKYTVHSCKTELISLSLFVSVSHSASETRPPSQWLVNLSLYFSSHLMDDVYFFMCPLDVCVLMLVCHVTCYVILMCK